MENMEKDLKLQNLDLHCRTCLCKIPEQRHHIQEIPTSLVKFLDSAGLKMPQRELFPNSMCDQCFDIVEHFDEFVSKLQQSTRCLEELLNTLKHKSMKAQANEGIKEIENLERTAANLRMDPLHKNEDFESVLVKLKIEMEHTSSDEEETNTDGDELISMDPIEGEENGTSCVNKPIKRKPHQKYAKVNLDTSNETTQIVCKYGCGKIFRRNHNAEAHYRFKHQHIENKIDLAENSEFKKCRANKKEEIIGEDNCSSLWKTTCNICFKNFATLSGLRSHMGTHGEVRPFQCDQCHRGFNMKARLKRHIRETHQDNPPEIPCKFGCGKMFIRHESAMNHYRVKHILPEKGIVPKTNTYICEDCGKTFKTMHNLKEHSYTHRPLTDRPFQCDQCQKRFISKRPYEIHLLRHAGIKNFECKICGLKTTTHNELRNHMNHHTKARQVNCPICSKTYTNPDNLRRHTLIVHQGVKNYKCRFCEEKFGKPDHLKHHEMRHTGERPHKCQICDRAFIQLVALKAHMKTHNKAT